MKSVRTAIVALAASLLVKDTSAVNLHAKNRIEPDVFGPNGEGYINNNTNIDMDQIGIDFIKQKTNKKRCENGQFAVISWIGSLEDGRVVTDSLQEQGNNVSLTIGTSQTYPCLDMALQQLHGGDSVRVSCPAHLVFGNDDQLSPLNGEVIPKNSKVSFDLNVNKCGFETPQQKFGEQPKSTTMQPDVCMYLHLVESDNTGYDLVLATMDDDESKKWPAKRVFFEQKVVDDETQQWKYNEKKGTITNVAYPKYSLASYQGWLWLANVKSKSKKKVEEFPTEEQKWFYSDKKQAITTVVDGIDSQVAVWGQPQQWAWAEVGSAEELADTAGSKFHIEYC